jgi:hypothetical protein
MVLEENISNDRVAMSELRVLQSFSPQQMCEMRKAVADD